MASFIDFAFREEYERVKVLGDKLSEIDTLMNLPTALLWGVHYEYERRGMCNVFLAFEPLAGKTQ